jgi:hypothetical protein
MESAKEIRAVEHALVQRPVANKEEAGFWGETYGRIGWGSPSRRNDAKGFIPHNFTPVFSGVGGI